MRIATWNVNSVTARLPRLLDWLGTVEPDVLCLQEIKTSVEAFPADAVGELGYESAVYGTGRWNGVAILSRVGIAEVRNGLKDEPGYQPEDAMFEATEPRAMGATCGGVRVWSIYAPNGRELGHPHYDYKLQWLAALHETVVEERRDRFALLGDFNIAPSDADVWDANAAHGGTHVSEPERAALQTLRDDGLDRRRAARAQVRHALHVLGLPRRHVPQEHGHADRPRVRQPGIGRERRPMPTSTAMRARARCRPTTRRSWSTSLLDPDLSAAAELCWPRLSVTCSVTV